jgi:hypothetical protein
MKKKKLFAIQAGLIISSLYIGMALAWFLEPVDLFLNWTFSFLLSFIYLPVLVVYALRLWKGSGDLVWPQRIVRAVIVIYIIMSISLVLFYLYFVEWGAPWYGQGFGEHLYYFVKTNLFGLEFWADLFQGNWLNLLVIALLIPALRLDRELRSISTN